MPAFKYIALDTDGRERKGMLEGDSSRHIRNLLREQGLSPMEVSPLGHAIGNRRQRRRFGPGMRTADIALFTRQLATLVRSSTPVEEALQTVAAQAEKPDVQGVVMGLRSRVTEGRSLASALGDFPHIFSSLYVATVESGERSGRLEDILDRLADYTESRQQLRRRVQTAMYYPLFLLVFTLGIVSFLLISVVPDVVQIFETQDAELPGVTKVLIALSSFLQNWWWLLFGAIAAAVVGWNQLLRRNEDIRRGVHRRLLQLPIIGKLIRGLNTARFTRSLSIQISSGVPALEALGISAQVIANLPMREAVEEAARRVREGSAIHKALATHRLFPPITLHLISSGEASGQLGEMLDRAASDQERETDSLITGAMSLFEPLMILLMAAAVGFIIFSILLPIFNINELIQ